MARPLFRAAPAALVLLLAACVPPPAPGPAPLPAPVPSPAPTAPAPVASPSFTQPVVSDWVHAPLTPGNWTWRGGGGESFAEFTSPQGTMLAQLTCTADREMLVAAAFARSTADSITIRTETMTRTVSADAREGWLETRVPARDPLLDAMAFSRGRLAIEDGQQALYLASYPEITRVIEDCR